MVMVKVTVMLTNLDSDSNDREETEKGGRAIEGKSVTPSCFIKYHNDEHVVPSCRL